jgi:hypothetical protein
MLRAFCFLLSAFAVSATTITFPLQALTGSRAARKIVITPANPISVGDAAITIGGPVSLAPTTNTPACNLVAGRYVVTFEGLPGSFTLNVPAGTNTYSALDPAVSSGLATYTYTNQTPSFAAAGYGLLAATNAGTVTFRADTDTLAVRDWVTNYVGTNVVGVAQQTNWDYRAITNAPWLTNGTAGIRIGAGGGGANPLLLFADSGDTVSTIGIAVTDGPLVFSPANGSVFSGGASGEFTGTFTGNGGGLTNIPASQLVGTAEAFSASSLSIGTTYPSTLSSDSTGLSVDASLTLGGTTPTLTFGSDGAAVGGDGTTLNVRAGNFQINASEVQINVDGEGANPTLSFTRSGNTLSTITADTSGLLGFYSDAGFWFDGNGVVAGKFDGVFTGDGGGLVNIPGASITDPPWLINGVEQILIGAGFGSEVNPMLVFTDSGNMISTIGIAETYGPLVFSPANGSVFVGGASGNFTGSFTGNGGGLTNIPASELVGRAGVFRASSLSIGTTYPADITSTSTGLVSTASLTLGGATPTLRFGSGGPTIAQSSTANITFGASANLILSAGLASTNAAVWMLNGTSSNSVAGMVVEPSGVTNFSYKAATIDSASPLGVVLDDGVAPGQPVRICDRGWCRVLVDGQSTTNWSGSWVGVSANLAGRAKVLSAPANSTDHDRELGHGGSAQAYAASTATTNLIWVFLHIGR